MYPEQLSDPRRGVLTTGRSRSTGPGGVPARASNCRAAAWHRDGPGQRRRVPGAHHPDRPAGRRADVGRHPGRQHPAEPRPGFRCTPPSGVVTVLIAAGLGWLLAGPAIRPLRRLTEQTMRLGKGTDRMPEVRASGRPRSCPRRWSAMLSRLRRRSAGHHQFAAGRTGLRGQRRARAAHPADGDARRPRHPADPRPARRRARRGGADLARAQRRVEAIITALGSARVGPTGAGRGP